MKAFVSSPLYCLQNLVLPLVFYLQSSLLAQPMIKDRQVTVSPSTENKTDNEKPSSTTTPTPPSPPPRRGTSVQLCPVGTCASRPGGGVLIIHQHVGRLVSARNSSLPHGRYSLEGPFLAVVVIGSIFLVLTVIFILVSFVFLKKQNKVFSLAAAAGGQPGEVLSHGSQARHLEEAVVASSEGYSISDSFDDISEESMSVQLPPEDEEEEEAEQREPGQVVIANTNATARHITFCSAHSLNTGRHHQGQSTALTGEFTATFVNSGTVQNFEV